MSISVENFKTYIITGNAQAPASIKRFDYVSKLSVALSLVGFLISVFDTHMMMMGGGAGALIGLLMLIFYIFVLYMIVMHAKSLAKWVYVILYAIGLAGFIMSLQFMFMFGIFTGLINLIQYGLGGYATYLLFQKDSREFLK